MGFLPHRTKAFSAVTASAVFALTAAVIGAAPAEAATVKTVKVHMSDNAITFKGAGATTANGVTTLRPGRYQFHVVSAAGSHTLQLLSFHNGYTPQQAEQDFTAAFEGNKAAVQRVDNGVIFRGGADAKQKHPANMVVTLPAGSLMAIDLNGSAVAQLNIAGKTVKSGQTAHHGKYTAFSFGWGTSKHLPASGMVKIANQADQPHFLVLQRVKSSTTNAQVRKFIKSGAQGNPSWGLKGGADTGVLSGGKSQLFSYDLKPGKYFVACFWPDYFTGMPHFMMGMWKLVTLS
jgi:hypothetical protein